jgi:glutamyl-tRNA(Gln) amidotransferase subunit D
MYSLKIEDYLKNKGISIGDRIVLKSEKASLEGILMPRDDAGNDSILVLKLDNGYNIGVKFSDNSNIEKISSIKNDFSFPKSNNSFKTNLNTITMIYTGGTIGSKIDYSTGGVYMLKDPSELLYEVPELSDIANIKVNDLMHIASEDMNYKEWAVIANAVADAFSNGSKGVVITHGTDTMHYTSAALSFMLKNLNAPVVLTGSQRSSDRGSSDAFMNLICSVSLAAKSDISEVGICMHSSSSDTNCNFIRGTKARKMHTSRRDAFKAINDVPIAEIKYDGSINYISEYKHIGSNKEIEVMDKFEPKVAIVKVHPNSDPGIIDYYMAKGYKGIIIEGTGLGHVPISSSIESYSWINFVEKATNAGIIVGIVSQCIFGRVNDKVYRNLRLLSKAGAIPCEDMTVETAYVKLGWLLGNYDKETAKEMFNKNLIGEIKDRTTYSEYF